MATSEDEGGLCCISHLFFRAASSCPNKVAVIHARGGSHFTISPDPSTSEADDIERDELFDGHENSPNSSAVYPGDECFTFSEILLAVRSLSKRISRVLDGGDDPDLIRVSDYFRGKGNSDGQLLDASQDSQQKPESQGAHIMHILESNVSVKAAKDSIISPLNDHPRIVGVHIAPSVEYIVVILAILLSGVAFLPIDPTWPKQRILSIISSSKACLIMNYKSPSNTEAGRKDSADWLLASKRCPVLNLPNNFVKGQPQEEIHQCDITWPCQSPNPRLFCYLMYTSGSSGMPKGVCGTEKGLINRFLWMKAFYPLHEKEVLLFKTSISFIDHIQEILCAILTCAPLIVPPFDQLKANPFSLINIMKAYHITRLIAVPSLVRAFLPVLQCSRGRPIWNSLQMLVLSGEVFPISLWKDIHELLPHTSVLNIYGSTEVSGDCTFFDCKNLPRMLETEMLSSVPIGIPISGCEMKGKSGLEVLVFRKLACGDYVFLGRKDRLVKVNGQRVGLEEIENSLRDHPDVVDVAVVSHRRQNFSLSAFIVWKEMDGSTINDFWEERFDHVHIFGVSNRLVASLKRWLAERLPSGMLPSQFLFVKSLPLSSSGKIYYDLLIRSIPGKKRSRVEVVSDASDHEPLQIIKKAFCSALMIEEIGYHDDFFAMGGNSIAAAQIAHNLGIDMRFLYKFPSPHMLLNALEDQKGSLNDISYHFSKRSLKLREEDTPYSYGMISNLNNNGLPDKFYQADNSEGMHDLMKEIGKDQFKMLTGKEATAPCKSFEQSNSFRMWESGFLNHNSAWVSGFCLPTSVAFSRCNKLMFKEELESNVVNQAWQSVEVPEDRSGRMEKLWNVNLRSCVDASPLVVLKDGDFYLFIGSHSHIFVCVNALSGNVLWEVELDGRIECSAAVTDDFCQIVVGCYKGKVYFINFMTGRILWAFQTGGEVKSQPLVDKSRGLVWCGSYDHNLYALDYKNHCCISEINCGGSIYGAPVADVVRGMLYVPSTSGRVTAVSLELPFPIMWLYESEAPIFGSLSMVSSNGNVICCLVNGQVIVLNSRGSVVWKAVTGGPIFAGACISPALYPQVLICSRNGSLYSFHVEKGNLFWEHQFGEPITSSVYVDENIELMLWPDNIICRLACVCSSSGIIHVIRVRSKISAENIHKEAAASECPVSFEFAKMDLPGHIFSSPLMIGGRIYVGCRDDHVYCIGFTC
ncbi:hypothetical protein AMTRI_Chr03g51560 [Amborella trichopoda]